ncbi:hypothetical protein Tco_1194902 [Tanacetum coccineum]
MSHLQEVIYLHPKPKLYQPSPSDLFFDISGTLRTTGLSRRFMILLLLIYWLSSPIFPFDYLPSPILAALP